MNKTILNLDIKKSTIILSIIGILFSLASSGYFINTLSNLFVYIIKTIIFITLYLFFYFIEKNAEFKSEVKIMVGYVLVNSILNIIFSIFITSHILKDLFITLSGIVCFWLIICFSLEILSLFKKNNTIDKMMEFNKKIGLACANPIIKFIETKTTND